LSPENRQKFPAIVIFPQCPTDSYWASVKIDRSKSPLDIDFTYNEQPNWPLAAAVDLVKQISKTEKVDKNRIYIMGLSMGGMGTFEAIARNPKLFAANLWRSQSDFQKICSNCSCMDFSWRC
jgi:predicted peptidase